MQGVESDVSQPTMQMLPPTARPMPKNFWSDPVSIPNITANNAVKTGIVGCMQVATTTPERSIPRIKKSWFRYRHSPRTPTCARSFLFGRAPVQQQPGN